MIEVLQKLSRILMMMRRRVQPKGNLLPSYLEKASENEPCKANNEKDAERKKETPYIEKEINKKEILLITERKKQREVVPNKG